MKTLLTPALGAALLLALGAQPALAAKKDKDQPAGAGPVVAQGIAWANIEAIHALSNAYKVAEQQRAVTYKPLIDQANARAQQLDSQLKAMAQKLDADSKLPKPNPAALQAQYQAIQRLEAAGKQEVQRMLLPVAMSKAYVDEQIDDLITKAIETAAAKRKVSLVVRPESLLYAHEAYNINQPVLDEINALLPTAQLVPPQGWEPREIREQRAAQAAQAGGAPAPAAPAPAPAGTAPAPRPAGPQPDGR